MNNFMIVEPPIAGTDQESLVGALERQRRIFAWKSLDLDQSQLQVAIASSSLTAGGLIKHLSLVEHEYFRIRIAGLNATEPWNGVDFENNPMWEWESAPMDSPANLVELWKRSVAESREILLNACQEDGVSTLVSWNYPDGRVPSVRRILLDLIEEYARHNGHLDLLREVIDGRVGEDPPLDFSF